MTPEQAIELSLCRLEALLLREAIASALRMADDALIGADGYWRDNATVTEQVETFVDITNESITQTLREARAHMEREILELMHES